MKKDEIVKILEKEYPYVKRTFLNYKTPFQLLVATILSQQASDKAVNKITKKLFKKYKEIKDFAKADLKELENDIKKIGLYKQKAYWIKKCAKIVLKKFKGKLPKDLEELLKLPGVGRKTANIILQNIYKITQGIAVDRHVKRIALRLGLTKSKNAEKVEEDLMKIFSKKYWAKINLLFIEHGRKICKAKKPLCEKCKIKRFCKI